ncbi:MAG: hypothetical protein ABIW76_15405 [Fibrobacteria bacterium]
MPLAVRNFFVNVKRGSHEKPSRTESRTAGMPAGIIRSAMEDTVNTSFDNPHARRSIEVRFIPGKPVPFSNSTDGIRTAGNRAQQKH